MTVYNTRVGKNRKKKWQGVSSSKYSANSYEYLDKGVRDRTKSWGGPTMCKKGMKVTVTVTDLGSDG